MLKMMIFISLFLVLFSCGKQQDSSFNEFISSSVIVDKLIWKSTHDPIIPHIIKTQSYAVGSLRSEGGHRCSGFLISNNIFLTSAHGLGHPFINSGPMDIVFSNDKIQKSYSCNHVIHMNKFLDYALIECDGSPGEKFGFLNLEFRDERPELFPKVYLLHQNCDYIQDPGCSIESLISPGKITAQKALEFHYTADSLKGSSGGPIFEAGSKRLIGIHSAGEESRPFRGPYNYGIPIGHVVKDIKIRLPYLF